MAFLSVNVSKYFEPLNISFHSLSTQEVQYLLLFILIMSHLNSKEAALLCSGFGEAVSVDSHIRP